jgi:hypothetical protein
MQERFGLDGSVQEFEEPEVIGNRGIEGAPTAVDPYGFRWIVGLGMRVA